MQFLLYSEVCDEDGHVCSHSVFLSVNLTKGVGDGHICRFLCFIPTSRAYQSRGNGSQLLQERLRLTVKQSFLAERIAEPESRLPGRNICLLQMPLFKIGKNSLDRNPSG